MADEGIYKDGFDFLGKMKGELGVEVGREYLELRVQKACLSAVGDSLRQWFPGF